MCFSNLPIEFDDEGNPYLAEEAEGVDRASTPEVASEVASDCDCAGVADDVTLDDADPESMYEEILETMPSDVREHLADSNERPGRVAEHERPEPGRTD